MDKMHDLEWTLEKYQYWKKDLIEKVCGADEGKVILRADDIESQIDLIVDLYVHAKDLIKKISEETK